MYRAAGLAFSLAFTVSCQSSPKDATVKNEYKRPGGEIVVITAWTKKKAKPEADHLMSQRTQFIQSLYQVHRDPYFGTPDKGKACLKDIQSEGVRTENEVMSKLSFQLKATAEFVYGVCDGKSLKYRSELQYLYCKNSERLYEIKTFAPINSLAPTAPDYREFCKDVSN